MTLNGGAAIAVLTQTRDLTEMGLQSQLRDSLVIWAVALFAASLVWIVAFLSARYVDREELGRADFYMYLGLFFLSLSFLAFLLGVITLANSLR